MTNDRYKVHNILNIAGKYFYADDKGTSQYHTICEKHVIKLFILTAIILVMISLSYGAAALSALYAIVYVDRRYTFLGTDIPYLDSSDPSDYAIVITIQFIISLISLLSNITIEIGVVLVHNAFELMPVLIRLRSDELSSELNTNGQSLNALFRFRNICLQIQDFNA